MKCNIRLPSIVKYHGYYAVMNLHFNPNVNCFVTCYFSVSLIILIVFVLVKFHNRKVKFLISVNLLFNLRY